MSLPEVVIAAFQAAGREAPDAARVDAIGYSAPEVELILAEVKRRRVPDQWDRA